MKLYSVTQGIEVKNFMCDSISVLPSGQITLHRDNEIIAVFNKDSNVVSIEDERALINKIIENKFTEFGKDIASVDKFFFTDVFFEKNTPEEARQKMRIILSKIQSFFHELEDFKI